MWSLLGPLYLHFPHDKEEMKINVTEFEAKFRLIQTFETKSSLDQVKFVEDSL